MKRTFIYTDEKSNKFWNIEITGSSFTVNYGKAGTAGQTQVKEFDDDDKCQKAAEKLIAEKIKKGYKEGVEDSRKQETEKPEPVKKAAESRETKEKEPEDKPGQSTDQPVSKNITLYFHQGASDKVYHAELLPSSDGSGYVVNVAWGRRGSTMQTGTKTVKPLTFEKAQAIYDKLVAEKLAKGYSPGEDSSLFIDTDNAGRISGLLPQLLNVIDEETLEQLIKNSGYCAQPKHDGERRMIKESQTGVNRKGLTVALPEHLAETFASNIHGTADIDGEMVGDYYITFDILSLNGKDFRELPYSERLSILEKHITPTDTFALIETAFTEAEKRILYERLKETNQEGIVFKRLDAPYTHGRPNSGGTQLKFKFCASATVYVVAQNEGKRSVLMGINDENGNCREVGSVTIPVNHPIPEEGQIIEVRYLYAYPQGSLYQPIYSGVRADMETTDCNISQLKYKATTISLKMKYDEATWDDNIFVQAYDSLEDKNKNDKDFLIPVINVDINDKRSISATIKAIINKLEDEDFLEELDDSCYFPDFCIVNDDIFTPLYHWGENEYSTTYDAFYNIAASHIDLRPALHDLCQQIIKLHRNSRNPHWETDEDVLGMRPAFALAFEDKKYINTIIEVITSLNYDKAMIVPYKRSIELLNKWGTCPETTQYFAILCTALETGDIRHIISLCPFDKYLSNEENFNYFLKYYTDSLQNNTTIYSKYVTKVYKYSMDEEQVYTIQRDWLAKLYLPVIFTNLTVLKDIADYKVAADTFFTCFATGTYPTLTTLKDVARSTPYFDMSDAIENNALLEKIFNIILNDENTDNEAKIYIEEYNVKCNRFCRQCAIEDAPSITLIACNTADDKLNISDQHMSTDISFYEKTVTFYQNNEPELELHPSTLFFDLFTRILADNGLESWIEAIEDASPAISEIELNEIEINQLQYPDNNAYTDIRCIDGIQEKYEIWHNTELINTLLKELINKMELTRDESGIVKNFINNIQNYSDMFCLHYYNEMIQVLCAREPLNENDIYAAQSILIFFTGDISITTNGHHFFKPMTEQYKQLVVNVFQEYGKTDWVKNL